MNEVFPGDKIVENAVRYRRFLPDVSAGFAGDIPPAVAGDNYVMPHGLPIADQARAIFKRNGIAVIGEHADSYFLPQHMLDTYYHVDSAAARLRTQRLIGRHSECRHGGRPRGRPTMALVDAAVRSLH